MVHGILEYMDLYASIAPIYDQLFPLPAASVKYLRALQPASEGRGKQKALDAGCATGSLAIALAGLGWEATGIEPEAAMVGIARASAARLGLSEAHFAKGDMLDARSLAGSGPYDLLLCLGNTLPHLSPDRARGFFELASAILAPNGSLVLQLLNYAKPGVGPGFVFPPIEASGYRFERRYEAALGEGARGERGGKLRFITRLVDTKNDSSRESELLLEPFTPDWIGKALGEAGFALASSRIRLGWRKLRRGPRPLPPHRRAPAYRRIEPERFLPL